MIRAIVLALLAACSSPAREVRPTPTPASAPPPPPDAAPVAVALPPDAAPGCLDEVGCLLAERPPLCCEKYSPENRRRQRQDPNGELPDTLHSDEVKAGVAVVKPDILRCGDDFPGVTGTVKLKVWIAPEGHVARIEVRETPVPSLGACCAAAMELAKFPQAQRETAFTYPFLFR